TGARSLPVDPGPQLDGRAHAVTEAMSDAKPLMAGNKAHPSYIKRLAALAALAATPLGAQVTPRQPPAAPVRPVTDTYFGAAVVDPYRWMEASDNATELREWMLAQNHYTRSMLERIRS